MTYPLTVSPNPILKRLQQHAVRTGLPVLLSLASCGAMAAVSFTGEYRQNFDSLASTGTPAWEDNVTLPGWYLFRKGGAPITTYMVGTGSANNGAYYSFGAAGSSDRALGAVVSANAFGGPSNGEIAGWMALSLKNDSGATIDALDLHYDGEQWRVANTNAHTMTLEYGFGDSYGAVSAWVPASDAFKWSSPQLSGSGAIDGNGVGRVANVGGELTALGWSAGQTLWLRWSHTKMSGNAQGAAIDNVVIKKADDATPVEFKLSSSVPANNATNASTAGTFTLNFSKAVSAGTGSFVLAKAGGNLVIPATDSRVTFSDKSVTIATGLTLDANTAYTLSVQGDAVKDSTGAAWTATPISFTTAAAANITRIHDIQGSGTTSPLNNQRVTVNAVVTAYMPGLSGFYIQEEERNYDADPKTSEGVFVYYGGTNPGVSESTVGQLVQFNGQVAEFSENTQLKDIKDFVVMGGGAMPKPVEVTLPVADHGIWESLEGMRVVVRSATPGGKLVVTDNYGLGRYGSVALSNDEVLPQYSDVNKPTKAGWDSFVKDAQRRQIVLDDASSKQNPDTPLGRGGKPLSAENTLRGGDSTDVIVGIVDQFVSTVASEKPEPYQTSYRVQPTEVANFTGAPRPTAQEFQQKVGNATVKIASANVLNFFSTVGKSTVTFKTPLGNSIGVRGAEDATEYKRQLDKLVANLQGLDADVYGLMEIQNNGFDSSSAVAAMVDALNQSPNKPSGAQYDFAKAPFSDGNGANKTFPGAGDDAITVAIIYRKDRVTPEGQALAPDRSKFKAFTSDGGGARVPVAQLFSVNTDKGPEKFLVVVNHFKSKGSLLNSDNSDIGDGQGNNNPARVETARQLKTWLATAPISNTTQNVVLLGDFNAYAMEDPNTELEKDNRFVRVSTGYSYSFKGLWGSLDHIFVTPQLQGKVGHVVKWAINAEEPVVLDYNTNFKNADQIRDFYAPTAYRSSDHNPIVMGLNFGTPPVNSAPVIKGIGGQAIQIAAGASFGLSAITVEDADNDKLTLTIGAVNGTLQGLVDADPSKDGIQLTGTAAQINQQLAAGNFVAGTAGNASVKLGLTDGVNQAVEASLAFSVSAVTQPGQGKQFTASPVAGLTVVGSLATETEGCQLSAAPQFVSPQSLGVTGMPSDGATLPHGLLQLNAAGCQPGETVKVTMTYSQDLPKGAQIQKWGRTADNQNKHWYTVPATVNGKVATFTIVDGGLGDDDLAKNGVIVDPMAIVVPKADVPTGPTNPTDPTGPTNPTNPGTPGSVKSVPTMSAWGLLVLALSFLPFAGSFVQRHSRKR